MLQKLKVFPQFFLVMLAGVFILPLCATASEAVEPLYQTAQVLKIPIKPGPLGGLTGK